MCLPLLAMPPCRRGLRAVQLSPSTAPPQLGDVPGGDNLLFYVILFPCLLVVLIIGAILTLLVVRYLQNRKSRALGIYEVPSTARNQRRAVLAVPLKRDREPVDGEVMELESHIDPRIAGGVYYAHQHVNPYAHHPAADEETTSRTTVVYFPRLPSQQDVHHRRIDSSGVADPDYRAVNSSSWLAEFALPPSTTTLSDTNRGDLANGGEEEEHNPF